MRRPPARDGAATQPSGVLRPRSRDYWPLTPSAHGLGEEIIAGSNERFRVADVVPFVEEDECGSSGCYRSRPPSDSPELWIGVGIDAVKFIFQGVVELADAVRDVAVVLLIGPMPEQVA
jgi:hypothetical protein